MIEWLRCPFCGEADHAQLGSLVSADRPEQTIEVCDSCKGYVKSVTTLTPIRPAAVSAEFRAWLAAGAPSDDRG